MNTHDLHDAHMNQRTIDYVEAVARGGAGMVILWDAYVDYPRGARMPDGLRIDSDEYIPGFSQTGRCCSTRHDCKLFVQMMHAGTLVPHRAFRAPPHRCFGDESRSI